MEQGGEGAAVNCSKYRVDHVVGGEAGQDGEGHLHEQQTKERVTASVSAKKARKVQVYYFHIFFGGNIFLNSLPVCEVAEEDVADETAHVEEGRAGRDPPTFITN